SFVRKGEATIYTDGVAASHGSIAPDDTLPVGSLDTDALDTPLNIWLGTDGTGTYTDGGSAEIDVNMDDLAIWRRALSADETACIFSNGQKGRSLSELNSVPPTPPVIGAPTLGAGAIGLTWTGGKAPFTVLSKAHITDPTWTTVTTTSEHSA